MKPSHLVIGAMSLVIILLLVLIARTKKKNDAEKESKSMSDHLLATVSTTTMIHPITEEELIISPSGSNAIDQAAGTDMMRAAISSVLSETQQMAGTQPAQITLNTYSSSGKLMGSTKVANPYVAGVPSGYPAEQKVFEGTINYSCSKEDKLDGPGYYGYGGDTLFGMYCS